ncbi:hypothetical protein [Methylophilus aquaticus]|uniref:Uncharacterized protein n=1 Tax=Methylophilus aquaticus TaxID=1971610 RepID=A0ABT9JUU7_9PROT|nr:hypothetical protein [Methylophilus aquaticus]MDP8568362.1 hypothetical protein [Methylophilus aquaticus]
MNLAFFTLSKKELLATIFAAFAASLFFSILTISNISFMEEGVIDYELILRTLLGLFIFSIPVTLTAAILLIVTFYLLIRYWGLVNIYTCTLVPFFILLVAQVIWSVTHEPSSFSHLRVGGHDLWLNGFIVWENWPALFFYWSEVAVYGAIGGGVFWMSLLNRPDI